MDAKVFRRVEMGFLEGLGVDYTISWVDCGFISDGLGVVEVV